MRQTLIHILCLFLFSTLITAEETVTVMQASELGILGDPTADVRIAYGEDPLQFADLWLPDKGTSHPVVILIHGGCWLSQYGISYMGKFAQALAANGIAVWNLEYRRVGDAGGGWPGTFQDIARGADHLLSISEKYELDTTRVISSGHSAGGHFALWLAARHKFKDHPHFTSKNRVALKGVLPLAPAPDLAMIHKADVCNSVIDKLMGGSPEDFPERYAIGSATELLPIGLPQILIIGKHDTAWRPVGEHHFNLAIRANDAVTKIEAAESGHFEMINPESSTWPLVLDAMQSLLK